MSEGRMMGGFCVAGNLFLDCCGLTQPNFGAAQQWQGTARQILALSLLLSPFALCTLAAEPIFRFEEKKGEYTDCFYGDKPVWRWISPTYDPKHHTETYKPYLQIYDFDGKDFITKGSGGKYTHHRGVFFGYNKVSAGDKTYDFWHMKDGVSQRFMEFTDENKSREVMPGIARRDAAMEWQMVEGTTALRELRSFSVRCPSGTERVFDFSQTLKSKSGPLHLDGDLQHAGFHFRAAKEVEDHEKDRPATYVLPPDFTGTLAQAEKKAPAWACMVFEVNAKKYGAMLMNHPDNGGKPVLSTRAYGRFGFFSPADLTPEKPLTLKHRLYIFDATTPPDAKVLEAKYQQYLKP